MEAAQAKEDVWIKTFCHGCLSAMCGMKVHRVDGVVVGIEGDPDNPYTEGRLCAKGLAHVVTLYDPNRPKKPLVRTNPEKGIGVDPRWQEVSWDEALDRVAKKLAETRKKDPTDLCLCCADISATNWMPVPIMLSFGTPNRNTSTGYYCAAAVHAPPYQTLGSFHMYPDCEYCKYLVLWGSNKGGVIQHTGTTAALDVANARIGRGMKLVCIDPVQSSMAAKADEWVPIRPGTDLAMALAWLHVLVLETGIYDEEFLKKYTNGPYLIGPDGHYLREPATGKPMMWDAVDGLPRPYDAEFKDVAIEGTYEVHVAAELASDGGTGEIQEPARGRAQEAPGTCCRPAFELLKEHLKSYTPEWAAAITTVPAATIRRLAREFGEAAQIGSTIKIEGHVLPFRPAAIHWYAGISQHFNGYVTGNTLQMINTIVGNLLVPGGVVGEGVIMESFPYHTPNAWTGKDPITGKAAQPGEVDGLFYASHYARMGGVRQACGHPPLKVKVPKTHSAEELFPVGWSGSAFFDLNLAHPQRYDNKIPRPKVLLTRHASNLTNHGNSSEVAEFFKNLYQISCEPFVDETAEFADIFLPTPVRLERLQLGAELPGYGGATIDLHHQCINLSTPVVPSETREMMDIWGEIADRVGFREEYNQMVNIVWDLQGEQRLQPDKNYTYREMQERFCKTLFGPDWDLESLAKVGHIKWRKTLKERYPRVFIEPRTPIYFEHYLQAGEELAKVTKELGFEWDVTDYKTLPTWRPGPALRETREEFDLFAVPFRVPFLIHQWGTHNPWLTELAEAHPWAFKIVMNAATAAKKGIRDGEQIVVEGSPGHKVQGKVKLTQCINPEVVAISRHGGHWAQRHSVSRGKGNNFNTLVPTSEEYFDFMAGGLEACIKVRVSRAK
ncbi:MAG: molybdopterin-dependent oxidoreductase [Chloroflexi bacterium]|nr:molybdopterin-dependent oxidoreductase [Chloroflexota bacterium]